MLCGRISSLSSIHKLPKTISMIPNKNRRLLLLSISMIVNLKRLNVIFFMNTMNNQIGEIILDAGEMPHVH
jgi:hypothetical protein